MFADAHPKPSLSVVAGRLATGVLLAGIVLIVVSCRPGRRGPPINHVYYEALGAGAARVTAEVFADSGEILLIFPPWGQVQRELEATTRQAFAGGLQSVGQGLRMAGAERIEYDRLVPGGGFSGEALDGLLALHPHVEVVVSLAGLPFYGNTPLPPPHRDRPVMVAYVEGMSAERAQELVNLGAADAIILPTHPERRPPPVPSNGRRFQFNRYYRVVR